MLSRDDWLTTKFSKCSLGSWNDQYDKSFKSIWVYGEWILKL